MAIKIIIPLLVVMISFLSCNDDSPTGAQTIDPSSIQGTWKLVKIVESRNSAFGEIPIGDAEILLQLNANQIISWTYLLGDCFNYEASAYTIQGNRLIGEEFEGEEMEDGKIVNTWSTSIAIDGGNLVITSKEIENDGDVLTRSSVYQPYNGAVPPADWPDEMCDDVLTKKKVSKNGKVLSRLLKQ